MANLANQRALAFRRQHGRCIYCDSRMWLNTPRELKGLSISRIRLLQATAEHKHARCDGGTNASTNIAAACWYCNQRRHRAKRPKNFESFQAYVSHRIAAGRWHGCSVTRETS